MKIAVVSPEPLGKVVSGIGIRFLSLARVLAHHHEVYLYAPEGSASSVDGMAVKTFDRGKIGRTVGDAAITIVQGEAANFFLSQRPDDIAIVDLYDPYAIEALNYDEDAHHFAFSSLQLQLKRGTFFLCASEAQRLFYAGALYHAGRIDPTTYAQDRELESILQVVPYGVPDASPRGGAGWLRERLDVPDDEPLVFFGGVYDWYDTDTLFQLWRKVTAKRRAHLVLCRHPRAETTPQERFNRILVQAEEVGMLDDTIHVTEWIPYEERVRAYNDCRLALSFHFDSFETTLSFRTRVLDFLWAGLPVLSSPGGGVSATLADLPGLTLLKQNTLTEAVESCINLLDKPVDLDARATVSEAVRRRLSWERVTRPIVTLLERIERGVPLSKHLPWWKRL